MYTIKWVAQRLGVAPGTLRAWEQRYGVVHPQRSEGGYRLYDEADLATLQSMADLVEGGLQPSQAAERVRDGRPLVPAPAVSGAGRLAESGLPDPGSLVVAARTYDVQALEATLDAAFATARFERVVDDWLMRAMAEIGEAWADGDLDVSQEHFISAGVMRRLAAAFEAAGHAPTGRRVVIGLTPAARHQIATFAFATMLRRAGLRVTYLGPDLPVASWVEAVGTILPDAVVIGSPRVMDAAAAGDIVRALAAENPGVKVFVGGPGVVDGHGIEASTLSGATAWLAGHLG